MSLLWVFYQNNVQKLKLSDLPSSHPVTIGPDVKDSVTIGTIPFESGVISLQRKESGGQYEVFQGNDCLGTIEPDISFILQSDQQSIRLILMGSEPEKSVYFTGNRDEIICSSEKNKCRYLFESAKFAFAEQSTFSLLRVGRSWSVHPESGTIFLNGEKIIANTPLQPGDEIFWNFTQMRVTEQDLLEVVHFAPFETALTETVKPSTEMQKKYPQYRRTPRMVYDLPDDRVSFSFPSQESDQTNRGLWLVILPPLVMLIVMGVVAIIQPRGIFILVSLAMFMMTHYLDGAIFPG